MQVVCGFDPAECCFHIDNLCSFLIIISMCRIIAPVANLAAEFAFSSGLSISLILDLLLRPEIVLCVPGLLLFRVFLYSLNTTIRDCSDLSKLSVRSKIVPSRVIRAIAIYSIVTRLYVRSVSAFVRSSWSCKIMEDTLVSSRLLLHNPPRCSAFSVIFYSPTPVISASVIPSLRVVSNLERALLVSASFFK